MSTDKGEFTRNAGEPERSRRAVAPDGLDWLNRRGACTVWLTAMLVGVLLPAWLAGGVRYQADVLAALVNPWLLVAMALLLGARAGGVNLSVWGSVSLGAVVANLAISRGAAPALAMLLAVCAGSAVGVVTAALMRLTRLSAVVVTVAVGAGLLVAARYVAQVASLQRLESQAAGLASAPELRMLLVAALYALTLLRLMRAERRCDRGPAPAGFGSAPMPTALVAGGALAAAAGSLILMGRCEYVSDAYLLGDLRPLAAVALAGGWLWRRREMMLLGAVLLPPAMLVATIWRQTVPPPTAALHASSVAPMVTLTVMVLALHWMARGRERGGGSVVAVALGLSGVVVTAMSAHVPFGLAENALVWAGAGLCLAAVTWVAVRAARRRAAHAAKSDSVPNPISKR